MHLVLFIVIMLVSFIIVRIGAIAFQLTGLEWSLAKFQAISCFTGTGFTTRESELITSNPQRRRIASFLMVLGNAGLVTLIATFVNYLRPNDLMPKFKMPFLHLFFPAQFVTIANLVFIIIIVYIIYKIGLYTKIAKKLTHSIRSHIVKKRIIKPVSFEELVVATGGYGIVSNIEIRKDSDILNKTLIDSDLRKKDIIVLAIERKGETIPNPSANTIFELDDRLICFGKLDEIREQLYKKQE